EEVKALGVYGYPAVFFGALLSSATVLMPGPGLVLVAAAAVSLEPLPVAALAGLGAALGEMTAYLAGYSGRSAITDRPLTRRLEGLMRRCGSLVLFVLAVIPNPFIDVGGLIAGALNMSAWRFLAATWLGKSLRYGVLAVIGALAL
ncbi:MAG: VTT domain-containing protein, partial [Candidatus Promineifilaceae bacterium]|nr:VTT domain-containing protein [Candidatus Promineifilaceae bacterium]